mgnify:CR=1 FL=1
MAVKEKPPASQLPWEGAWADGIVRKDVFEKLAGNKLKHHLKRPEFIHSINKRFNRITNKNFDYVLAYAIFPCLPTADIEECIRNVKTIMHNDSVFIFSYLEGNKNRRLTLKDFCYTEDFFIKIASKYGFKYTDISHIHNHPNKHKLIIYKL